MNMDVFSFICIFNFFVVFSVEVIYLHGWFIPKYFILFQASIKGLFS